MFSSELEHARQCRTKTVGQRPQCKCKFISIKPPLMVFCCMRNIIGYELSQQAAVWDIYDVIGCNCNAPTTHRVLLIQFNPSETLGTLIYHKLQTNTIITMILGIKRVKGSARNESRARHRIEQRKKNNQQEQWEPESMHWTTQTEITDIILRGYTALTGRFPRSNICDSINTTAYHKVSDAITRAKGLFVFVQLFLFLLSLQLMLLVLQN